MGQYKQRPAPEVIPSPLPASVYLGQAVLTLRRKADAESDGNRAARFLKIAKGLQNIIAPLEALESEGRNA